MRSLLSGSILRFGGVVWPISWVPHCILDQQYLQYSQGGIEHVEAERGGVVVAELSVC